MKKKAYLIFLVLGLALLAVGVFFFGRICAVKDSIYANYSLSFSDASFEKVFINDHDEATVASDFDAAVLHYCGDKSVLFGDGDFSDLFERHEKYSLSMRRA